MKDKGGECIPVQCDHSKDEDIKGLFDRVSREQEGKLDVLVNNAYSGVQVSDKNHLNSKNIIMYNLLITWLSFVDREIYLKLILVKV